MILDVPSITVGFCAGLAIASAMHRMWTSTILIAALCILNVVLIIAVRSHA